MVASHFRWHGDAFTDGQIIDTLTPRHAGRKGENDPLVKAEPVWDPSEHPGSWRAVWAYSAKRAARDSMTLTLQENRAKAVVAGEKAARTPRFVKTTNGSRSLDDTALGSSSGPRRPQGLRHQHPRARDARSDEVIASYHDLWQVEQSFRMSKTDLARQAHVRPHPRRDRGPPDHRVHRLGDLPRRAEPHRAVPTTRAAHPGPLRSATVEINGVITTIPPALGPDEATILNALQHPTPRH